MKNVSLYEQLGILIPGAVLLFGIILLVPGLKPLLAAEGVTVGGLGLYLVLSYPLGHLIASLGNVIEKAVWPRGVPSSWIARGDGALIGVERTTALKAKLAARLGIDFDIAIADRETWRHTFGQLYRDLLISGRAGRVEAMNGTYGLVRGLACAALLLAVGGAVRRPPDWLWLVVTSSSAAIIFMLRMRRFGTYFAREVLFAFILLPDARESKTQAPADSPSVTELGTDS